MPEGKRRPNSDGFWQRLLHGAQRVRQRPDWYRLAGPDWPQRIMTTPVADRYHAKQGRSIGRLFLERGDVRLAVYLKRHYRVAWWRGLLATLFPHADWSPGLREWAHLRWAKAEGFPVPAAVAAGEFIGPWGRLQSFLAVEELTGMLPLHEAIPLAGRRLTPATFARWKRGLTCELARLTQALHRRRYFHKDLYLCHFYVREADIASLPDWPGRVHLIDLHRLGRHRWGWRWWQVKDLAQLLFSSELTGITARDRLRFWRAYLGGGKPTLADRLVRRAILLRSRRYRTHQARRSLQARLAEKSPLTTA